jgi:glycine/D-amino acid oxidase-like deaminating enzyme
MAPCVAPPLVPHGRNAGMASEEGSMGRVADKVALVTGAGGGIGGAGAEALAREGAAVFCTDRNGAAAAAGSRVATGCARPCGGRCDRCRCRARIRPTRYRARIGWNQPPPQFSGCRCRDLGPDHRCQSYQHASRRTGDSAANGQRGRRQHHQRDLAARGGGAARSAPPMSPRRAARGR